MAKPVPLPTGGGEPNTDGDDMPPGVRCLSTASASASACRTRSTAKPIISHASGSTSRDRSTMGPKRLSEEKGADRKKTVSTSAIATSAHFASAISVFAAHSLIVGPARESDGGRLSVGEAYDAPAGARTTRCAPVITVTTVAPLCGKDRRRPMQSMQLRQ